MSDVAVKANVPTNSGSMPTVSKAPKEDEEPVEVLLAMLYTAAILLQKRQVVSILSGTSPITKKPVIYIRIQEAVIDPANGFKIIESVGSTVGTTVGSPEDGK